MRKQKKTKLDFLLMQHDDPEAAKNFEPLTKEEEPQMRNRVLGKVAKTIELIDLFKSITSKKYER